MANQLNMADAQFILTLHQRGWSRRRIARELGIDRETVGRYVFLAAGVSKPANALTGIEANEPSKPANALAGTEAGAGSKPAKAPPGSPSRCAPWRGTIVAK